MPTRLNYVGTTLTVAEKDEVLEAVDKAGLSLPITIATVNPEFLLTASKNSAFRHALGAATFCTVDGSGFLMGLRVARFFRRIPNGSYRLYHGSDLVADLFRRYRSGDKKFYLIGGPEGQAERTAAAIRSAYPDIAIAGAEDGGRIDSRQVVADPVLLQRIKESGADILLIGFGAPKQELWMQAAGPVAPVMIGVGGTFGFYTDKKRAPRLWRSLHMEWLYRALTEPGHWRRAIRASVIFPLRTALWVFTGL